MPNPGCNSPAGAVLAAMDHETVEMIIVPAERDLHATLQIAFLHYLRQPRDLPHGPGKLPRQRVPS